MASKYYVIWQGRETGIFTDWANCKKHIDHFPGARYKSFKTLPEAEAAYGGRSPNTRSANSKSATAPKSKRATVKTYSAAEVDKLNVDTKIFTDGGCEPNPGEAGSGLAVYRKGRVDELWYGLYNPKGTNNTAELSALFEALVLAKKEVESNRSVAIFCDSKYSIQCITQWAVSWEKKGWKKAGGEIKNLDLIKKMFALYLQLKSDIKVLHVNGHVGVEGNELADRMSILAMESKEPRFIQYTKDININSILALRAG
ncbi:ribonuclease H family protein [Alkalimarinus alittae]|uniref:ribonuclease H n=1 Tax=Alkalimarinus alittae TaxID=2961619 RepID=A0ABY6MXL1_9ALTE|nr:ribonuclease H family protein [Alkalimarinus alittae]UZE94572.1 ribonuclease H family protein [Alkalimarinus alittae]